MFAQWSTFQTSLCFQQDTGEPYNSETDLETQSLDEPGPIIPGKSIVDEFHPIPNDPHTDKEAQAVAGGQPETGDEPVNTGGEPVNTGGEPVNTGGEPGETDQMQADIVNTDIETNIADVDIMDMETKRVGDSMTNPIVNTKVEIDDGIDPYEELDMMFQMKLAGLHNASEFCQMLDIDCEGQLFTSRVMRKPIFRVYEQVRHEPGCK